MDPETLHDLESTMIDPLAQRQLHLAQNQKTNELFKQLATVHAPGAPFILLCFDLGQPLDGALNNASYASNISDEFMRLATAMALWQSWEQDIPRILHPHAVAVYKLPIGAKLVACADFCKQSLSEHVGFCIVFGLYGDTVYISNADVDGLRSLLGVLIQNWREDVASKPLGVTA